MIKSPQNNHIWGRRADHFYRQPYCPKCKKGIYYLINKSRKGIGMLISELFHYLEKDTPIQEHSDYHFYGLQYFMICFACDKDKKYSIFSPKDINIDTYYNTINNDEHQKFIIISIEEVLYNNKILNRRITPKEFALFNLLHEEGHWKDYRSNYFKKKNSDEFYLDQKKEMDLIERFKYSPSLYYKNYREISFEKYADKYAISKLKELNVFSDF